MVTEESRKITPFKNNTGRELVLNIKFINYS